MTKRRPPRSALAAGRCPSDRTSRLPTTRRTNYWGTVVTLKTSRAALVQPVSPSVGASFVVMLQRRSFVVLFTYALLALPPPSYGHVISTNSSPHSTTLPSLSLLKRDAQSKESQSFQGWTPQPNGRGTIDIIWSCVFTIFLCSWTVLCLNVPAETDAYWKINWRKFMLAGLCNLGPEFILQLALGQWISATRSKKQFHDAGFYSWTMNHAFFADMGGFVLKPPDWVPFPLNAKQMHYLVVRGHLGYPTLTRAEIKDKNKVDGLLRLITVAQTLWFVLNCVARAGQHLDLTTFELTTVGFIFCTLGTHLCWAHKPADVQVPVILHSKTSLKQILIEAGDDADGGYSQTPLDFISRKEWSWSLWWAGMMNTLRVMHIRVHPKPRPITRIPNDNWPALPSSSVFMLGFVDMCYAAIYMAGWNFTFATQVERLLWRISTTTIMGIVVTYLIIDLYAFHLMPALPAKARGVFKLKGSPTSLSMLQRRNASRTRRALDWLRNSSQNKDPQLYMPLKASVPITTAAIVYGIARGYLLLECVVALRWLPSSAYESVNWSAFLPHV